MRKIQRRRVNAAFAFFVVLGCGAPLVFAQAPPFPHEFFAKPAAPSDAELAAAPPAGQSVEFYEERLNAIQARIASVRESEGEEAARRVEGKFSAASSVVLFHLSKAQDLSPEKQTSYFEAYLAARYTTLKDVDALKTLLDFEKAKTPRDDARIEIARRRFSRLCGQVAETSPLEPFVLFSLGDILAQEARSLTAPIAALASQNLEILDGETPGYYRRAYLTLRQTRISSDSVASLRPKFDAAYRAIFRNLAEAAQLPASERETYFKRYLETLFADEAREFLREPEKWATARFNVRNAAFEAFIEGGRVRKTSTPIGVVDASLPTKRPDPYAGFDETLLDVPEDASDAFYLERLGAFRREIARCAAEFQTFHGVYFPPLGQVLSKDGIDFRSAPQDSLSARAADVYVRLNRRVADATELPKEVRDQAFVDYVLQTAARSGAQERRGFFAELLAAEEAKTPVDLPRAYFLRVFLELAEENVLHNDFARSGYVSPLSSEALKSLLDVPSGQSAEFYRARNAEIRRELAKGGSSRKPLNDASVDVSRRLAYADDATSTERFAALARCAAYLAADARIDALQDLGEREAARDVVDEIDAARTICVERALLLARLRKLETAVQARLQEIATSKGTQNLSADELKVYLTSEQTDELLRIVDEIAERADDGAFPWEIGDSWSLFACRLADRVEKLDGETATRLRQDVLEQIVQSTNAFDKEACDKLKKEVDAETRQN
ncbi:MAG: hypothetical protein IKU86_05290 [Thermoguttaceae bacterium]|nr:hypothetical protein [Thermoguttaceae bacterium]